MQTDVKGFFLEKKYEDQIEIYYSIILKFSNRHLFRVMVALTYWVVIRCGQIK